MSKRIDEIMQLNDSDYIEEHDDIAVSILSFKPVSYRFRKFQFLCSLAHTLYKAIIATSIKKSAHLTDAVFALVMVDNTKCGFCPYLFSANKNDEDCFAFAASSSKLIL